MSHTALVLKTFFISLMLAFVAMLAVSPVAQAAASVTISPYQNLSTTSPTTVTVSGTGLLPNTEFNFRQVAMQNYDTGTSSGVWVEQQGMSGGTTDANGNFTATATVKYDVRPDLLNINYCDNSTTLLRLCYLQVSYIDSGLEDEVIGQYKLYFGVSGPVVVPEDPGENTGDPLTRDDCKDGKWSNFTLLGFNDQGACVSFVSRR